MNDFSSLCVSPWLRVDPNTWEVLEVLEENYIHSWKMRPWSYQPPIYPQEAIDSARATTSLMCEKILAKITWWKRVLRWNNRGSDILLRNGKKLEAKVWRVWNSAVVKQNQLFEFDADFWWFLYYATKNNLPPSYFTSQNIKISQTEYLLRNIKLKVAFIFPTNVIRYYWNTTPVKKWIISTTGIAHRPLAVSRAETLFHDTEILGERFESFFTYGKYTFPVKTIDFSV